MGLPAEDGPEEGTFDTAPEQNPKKDKELDHASKTERRKKDPNEVSPRPALPSKESEMKQNERDRAKPSEPLEKTVAEQQELPEEEAEPLINQEARHGSAETRRGNRE